jgi:hypothetical protein
MVDGQQRWTVRDGPADLTSAVSAAAAAREVTVGQFVTAALRAYLAYLELEQVVLDRGKVRPAVPAPAAVAPSPTSPIPSPAPYIRRRAALRVQAVEQAGGGRPS